MTAHRATHLLHSTLSIASSSALSNDISRPLKSFLTVSVQFFCGLPLFPQEANAKSYWVFYTCPCPTCDLLCTLKLTNSQKHCDIVMTVEKYLWYLRGFSTSSSSQEYQRVDCRQ